jgi:hypothetical protein
VRAKSRRASASRDLHEAEDALHVARQSGVDEWVMAASEHLHIAVLVLAIADADLVAATRISEGEKGSEQRQREFCPAPVRRRRAD